MSKLEDVKKILYAKNASLVVYYTNGEIKEYYKNRVDDIKNILHENENALRGAVIADKVIGKFTGSLLTVAGVKEIYADVISEHAIPILEQNNVKYEYKEKVDFIVNNTKTGMCPMENKYKNEKDIFKIYNEVIKNI